MVNLKHGRRSAQAIQEHEEVRSLLREAKRLSQELEGSFWDESMMTLDEVNHKFDQLTEIHSKLFSIEKRFKYLSVTALIALLKYFDNETKRILKFFERIIERQKHIRNFRLFLKTLDIKAADYAPKLREIPVNSSTANVRRAIAKALVEETPFNVSIPKMEKALEAISHYETVHYKDALRTILGESIL